MMEKPVGKPFYFHPPWNILFDLHRLERVNPWDISVSYILSSFQEEMDKRGEVDFRASGVALDSSATIYLMKSKLLLELEAPPLSHEPKTDFIPPPLILPLRYELTTTTIQNLLDALDEALNSEKLFSLRAPLKAILPPPPEILPTISAYIMEMEEQIEKLTQKIRSLIDAGELITFSKLVKGLTKIEQIRIFIILLFMAQKEKVTLWQDEDFNEIIITLNGG
ncbi:MAG: hypothetical protein QXG97_05715 [Nitrososphaerota archaeon]